MIPLRDAVLCEDCRIVGYQKNGRCEFCGSQAFIWLQPILEPKKKPERVKA